MMPEVVKVQIALSTNDPHQRDLALVYEQGRKRMVQQSLDPATQAAMGDDVKAFFYAQFSIDRWVIGRRVNDRDW